MFGVLRAAELERAVDHRSQHAGSPPTEAGLARELRAVRKHLEAFLGVAFGKEQLARERQGLRFASTVAVQAVELEAFGNELASRREVASVHGGVPSRRSSVAIPRRSFSWRKSSRLFK